METRRQDAIFEIYKDIEDVLQIDDNFRRIMTTEFDHVTKDLNKLRSKLSSTEYPILFAGETSCGKSSLINLLIGKSILPAKLLRCTPIICKIWNSEQREIVFTKKNDETERHVFEMDDYEDDMRVLLSENFEKESKYSEWKYVDIYLPVPLLKNGITFVDTPGVNEKDNTTLLDYLPNAIALVYVIDPERAGGLENDQWLKNILMNITEQQERGLMLHLQTETILFVCNKWDRVKEKEQHDVTDFIMNKLELIVSDFKPDMQLFRLSCEKEQERILDNSHPTKNYIDLIEAISKMMPILLEAKLLTHARWQKCVVQKMIDRISSMIITSKQTQAERERRIKEAEHRIKFFQNRLEAIKLSAFHKIDEIGREIAMKMVHHLVMSRDKMKTFNDPYESEYIDYPGKKTKARVTAINNEISTWCRENKDYFANEMKSMMKKEFMITEEDLGIQNGLFGSFQSYYRIVTILPFAVFGLSPCVSNLMFASLSITPFHLITEVYVLSCIRHFLQHLKDQARRMCEVEVPRTLKADKSFIDNALKLNLSLKETMDKYRPLQYKCEMILGKIEILLVRYFPEFKLSFQYIETATFEREIGKGSYAVVHSAMISINNEDTIVAVKTLNTPLDDTFSYRQLSEALMLRELNKGQQHIIKLYGISLSESLGNQYLQIYMEYCDDSLFNIVMKKQTPRACSSFKKVADCRDSWTFVIRIMEGLCAALDYVHRAGFVHRDLKLDNILVKGGHSVRLADFGFSKNEANITGTTAGTPLYMAPEVMKGYLYGSEADIYSLGMVLYELWYYRPVFTRPLQSNPSKYAYTVHCRKELEDNVLKGCRPDCEIPNKPPVELKALMETCWDANREKRPTADEVYNCLTKVQLK